MTEIDWYQKAIDKLGWIEITCWYRPGNRFNHIELGHNYSARPVGPLSWDSGKWYKKFTYAIKNTNPLKVLK